MRSKKSLIRLTLISSILLLFATCAFAQDVTYNFLQGTDFSKFKTYKWVNAPDQKYPSEIVDTQIKESIDKQFAAKGLTKISDGMPDIYAIYQVAIDQQTEWYSFGTGWWGMGGTSTTSYAIHVGTLVIDLYDTAAKKMVWTGRATKQLNPSKDPAKNQKNLDKAMAKLMKNFPPPVKK
jgi:hypothetical protein